MKIEVLKSKIHRIKVTDADIDYIGSIEIDENIMNQANLIAGEKVHLLSLTNGERLVTYVIKGEKNSNRICVNGPAAKKIQKGHEIIIISYASLDFEEAKKFEPTIIHP
tara:strand:+ start:721 stop:1047 length:327 start_codon:yes stop_codon:yes gene_type:complete